MLPVSARGNWKKWNMSGYPVITVRNWEIDYSISWAQWQIQELSVGGTLFIVIIPTFPHCCTRSISMYHTFISATLIRWLITENVQWYDLFQVPFYWGKGEGTLNPSRRRQI